MDAMAKLYQGALEPGPERDELELMLQIQLLRSFSDRTVYPAGLSSGQIADKSLKRLWANNARSYRKWLKDRRSPLYGYVKGIAKNVVREFGRTEGNRAALARARPDLWAVVDIEDHRSEGAKSSQADGGGYAMPRYAYGFNAAGQYTTRVRRINTDEIDRQIEREEEVRRARPRDAQVLARMLELREESGGKLTYAAIAEELDKEGFGKFTKDGVRMAIKRAKN